MTSFAQAFSLFVCIKKLRRRRVFLPAVGAVLASGIKLSGETMQKRVRFVMPMLCTFSKRAWLQYAAAALLIGAGCGSSQAASGGRQYFSIGGGGGILTNKQPCPDLPCNGKDTCSCISSSGSLNISTPDKNIPKTATYTLELSADVSTFMPNGVGGLCYGSGGYMVITTSRGTLNLQFSGPACRLGMGGGGPDAVAYGTTSPIYVVSGTGDYKNPVGTGSLSASFDPPNKAVLIDLVAYGVLR